MKRWSHNLQLALRRAVLAVILLVPGRWRAALARNSALTRVYEFFDKARYEQQLQPATVAKRPPVVERPTPQPLPQPPPQPLPEPPVAPPVEPPRKKDPPPAPKPRGIPLAAYEYCEPHKTAAVDAALARAEGPLVSILMPVYNTPAQWLQLAIESVKAQWYPHWELCIADDGSTLPETLAVLAALDDPRIRVRTLAENQHIVGASNAALAMARGEFVALLDHDDELTPDALFRVWEVIDQVDADFIYSDEDKIDIDGKACDVHFKSGYSPEQFLAHNYLCHLSVIRRSLVEAVDGFSPGTEGAQDYDLFLKVLEHTQHIAHIPRVLYHWRKIPGSTAAVFSEKSYAQDAGATALRNAIKRRGLDAGVEPGYHPGNYRVRYAIQGTPLVSIIIPFRDRADLLDSCLDALLSKSSWGHFEIIGVSNNSEQPETFAAMQRWAERDARIRFFEHNQPFNFSTLNNAAVRDHARGEQLVFLNNDIEVISADWVESLLEFSQRPDVGVVGGRLYYPDGRVQHAGVILGMGGVAGHLGKMLKRGSPGYKARPRLPQNLCAVTAALCMVKRSTFDQVGGFDPGLFAVAFNDVDLCMRVHRSGYLNVYTPFCEAWHQESVSRGYEDTPEKKARFGREVRAFKARFADELAAGDPYFNPNFALMTQGQVLLAPDYARPPDAGHWRLWPPVQRPADTHQ